MNAIRILLVSEDDDTASSAKSIKAALNGLGHEVTGIYAPGQETVTNISRDKPDIVLMCVKRHDDYNIKTVHQIKSQFSIPVILTNPSTQASIEKMQDVTPGSPFLGHIIKPFNIETLRNDIEISLRQHRCDSQIRENNTQSFLTPFIRVLVIDDRPLMQCGLKKLIDGKRPHMEIIGSAYNTSDAIQLVNAKQPHITLLNMHLGDEDCIPLISDLLKQSNTRIIVLARHCDSEVAERAVRNGACGILQEKLPKQDILKAIEKIYAGEFWIDRNTTSRILTKHYSQINNKTQNVVDPEADKIASLTRKEKLIVETFAQVDGGTQNKQIAAILSMGQNTLRNHLTSIFSKLEITNRYELFVFAKRHYRSSVK